MAESPEPKDQKTVAERRTGDTSSGQPMSRHADRNGLGLELWAFTGVIGLGVGAAWLALVGDDRSGAGLIGAILRGVGWLLPAVLFVPVAALVAVRLSSASWEGWRKGSAAFALRISIYLLLAGIGVTSILSAFGRLGADGRLAPRFCGWTWMVLEIGALLLFCVAPGSLARPARRLGRTLDLLAFNAAVLLLVSEALIGLAALLSSSPILRFEAVAGDGNLERRVRDTLQRFRLSPTLSISTGS